MTRPRHTNKEIEAAVKHAESLGWRFAKGRGHVWGILYCPASRRGGCRINVHSTPRNREGHARHVRDEIDKCEHAPNRENEG